MTERRKLHTGKEAVTLGPFEQILGRFWSKVEITSPDKCWMWKGSKSGPNISGKYYGGFTAVIDGVSKSFRAHRLAYMLMNGPIPDGQVLRHKCDETLCVNPFHLEPGSQGDNVRDALRRGRCLHGRLNGSNKLTEDEVLSIYYSDEPPNVLADRHNIHPTHVENIRRRKKWKRLLESHPVREEYSGNG